MVSKVAARILSGASKPSENIRELEQLLALAKGTNYEGYVKTLLKKEKAKLKR